jgi:hypothetical protein
MRSMRRMVVVALAAVCVVGAVASASASAAECPGTGEGVALCSGGHALEGSFAFTGKMAPGAGAWIEVTGFGRIPCSSTSTGTLVAGKGKLEVTGLVLHWTGCKVLTAETTCQVKQILWDGYQGLGTGPGLSGLVANTNEVTLSSTSPNHQLTTNYIEGKAGKTCLLAGEYVITGKQTCALPNSTVESLAHILECKTTGSKLTWAGKSMQMWTEEELQLSSGKTYSLQHG